MLSQAEQHLAAPCVHPSHSWHSHRASASLHMLLLSHHILSRTVCCLSLIPSPTWQWHSRALAPGPTQRKDTGLWGSQELYRLHPRGVSKAISKYSSDLLSRVAEPFIPEADDLCIASYDITNAVGFPPKWNNSPLRGKAWLVFNRTKDPYQLSFLLKL